MNFKSALGALAAIAAAAGLFATAAADPVSKASGRTVLPTTGLVIDLPAKAGTTYNVSASWSLTHDGESFDSRDVVDEFSGGQLAAGNWVLLGYFDAGACDGVLATSSLDKAWTTRADLWGKSWLVHGGVYTFENSLGRKPAAIACRDDVGGLSVLLYRFLVSQPETIGQDAIMADLRSAAVLERASRAYDARQVELTAPLTHAEVTNRGVMAAVRRVDLTESGLTLDLPDDGYVWLAHPGDNADMLERMAPFFPEVSLEVLAVEDAKCADIFESFTSDVERKPGGEARNLPGGWTAGPALVDDGIAESIICRPADYGALAVGIFFDGNRTDASDLHPILGALANAKPTP